MKTVYLIILLALVGWKGYHAWLRGRKSWTQDMQQYQSFLETCTTQGFYAHAETVAPVGYRSRNRHINLDYFLT